MKTIAILFPGHIRSYNKTRENIYNRLIIPLRDAGYVCNVFTSIWDISGYRENGWGGCIDAKLLEQDSTIFESEESKRAKFIAEFHTDSYSPHFSGPETCGDAVSMWYKIWKTYELSLNVREHDIIIRLRPDIMFTNDIDVALFSELAPNTIYMSPWHGKYESVTYKMMDHFGFGDFDSMTKYCSIFPNIRLLMERNVAYCTAEGFLYNNILYNDLNIKRVPIKYGVLRSHGFEEVA